MTIREYGYRLYTYNQKAILVKFRIAISIRISSIDLFVFRIFDNFNRTEVADKS